MSIFPVASDSVTLDTAQVETTDVWANGFRLNPVTGGVRASFANTVSTYNQGIPLDSNGAVCLVDSTASFPASTWNNGIPLSNQKVCLSSAASSTYSNGLPMAANGGLGGLLVPSMSLYFLSTASLDSRITFTRADAVTCATYFDSTGRMQTAAANVARFDYDPASPAGVTGPELAPSLTDASAWSLGSGWSVSGGYATRTTAGGFSNLTSVVGYTVGKTYQIVLGISAISGSGVKVLCGSGSSSAVYSSVGTYTFNLPCIAGSANLFIQAVDAGTTVTISSLSVKEVTFTPRGLLIEESRQNLLLQSRDMTQAAWTKTDVTPARTQVGIDGVANTACLMTEATTTNTHTVSQTVTTTIGQNTISFVVKAGTAGYCAVYESSKGGKFFNLQTGAVMGNLVAAPDSASITNLGGGWYRCSITVTMASTTAVAQLFMSPDGTSFNYLGTGRTLIVDCAQLEVGAFATSIIPTTTTALTRAADSASMTGTNFSSWFNASAGTFVVEYVTTSHTNVPSVWSWGTATSNAGVSTNGTSSTVGESAWNGSVSLSSSNTLAVGAVRKSALAYASNSRGLCLNGGTVATDANNAYGVTPVAFYMGSVQTTGSQSINGHIRSIRYYPTRLANATLQALTA